MEVLLVICCLLYLLSTVGYVLYLFVQRDRLQRGAFVAMTAALGCHSLAIAAAWAASGHIPVRNLYETLSLAAWAVAAVFVAFSYRLKLKVLGVFAAPLVSLIMLIATQLPRETGPASDLFTSFWLGFHVVAIFIGEAAFALACGVGVLYLLQERAIKTKRRGFFFKRLPALELLDSAGYACIITGFTLLTVGLATGIVYAKLVWGKFWTWDPKEVWSAITWLLYAALLHERLTVGWRGRRSAILAIVGFIVVLFTFIGVNFLFQGHHGTFTRM